MTKHIKSRVPIVNVFDEEEKPATSDLQPAHRPVVVEIEDVAPKAPESAPVPPPTPVFSDNVQPPEPQVMAAPTQAPSVEHSFGMQPQAPVVEAPPAQPAMEQQLPSFFEQDLKGTPSPEQPMQGGQVPPAGTSEAAPFNTAVPQAMVGEIHEAAEGGNTKKIIGIVMVVLAIIILAVGGLFLYARSLFAPVEMPKSTPTPAPTVRPTTTPAPTPTEAPAASVSAAMKKSVKVDVLNGTKIAGLASKEAAVLKKEGYVTGTVGNGKPEAAGTIVSASSSAALVKDIQKILSTFTFKLTTDPKATSIVVTLGEPKE